jgi:hypothetical protein
MIGGFVLIVRIMLCPKSTDLKSVPKHSIETFGYQMCSGIVQIKHLRRAAQTASLVQHGY